MDGNCGNDSCDNADGGDDGGADGCDDGGGGNDDNDASQDEPNSKATSLRDGPWNSSRRHRLYNSPPVLSKVDKGAFHYNSV